MIEKLKGMKLNFYQSIILAATLASTVNLAEAAIMESVAAEQNDDYDLA